MEKKLPKYVMIGAALTMTASTFLNHPFNDNNSQVSYEYHNFNLPNDYESFSLEQYQGKKNWSIKDFSFNPNLTLYENKLDELLEYFEDCEENEIFIEEFFENIYKESYFEDFYNWMFMNVDNNQKFNVLLAILSSKINIFNKWYTKSLLSCVKSNDKSLAKKANSIYELYKTKFEELLSCM